MGDKRKASLALEHEDISKIVRISEVFVLNRNETLVILSHSHNGVIQLQSHKPQHFEDSEVVE
jgi:hypothetical protein